jgi:hypothetical protein
MTLMGALNRIGGLLRIWNEIEGVAVQIPSRATTSLAAGERYADLSLRPTIP